MTNRARPPATATRRCLRRRPGCPTTESWRPWASPRLPISMAPAMLMRAPHRLLQRRYRRLPRTLRRPRSLNDGGGTRSRQHFHGTAATRPLRQRRGTAKRLLAAAWRAHRASCLSSKSSCSRLRVFSIQEPRPQHGWSVRNASCCRSLRGLGLRGDVRRSRSEVPRELGYRIIRYVDFVVEFRHRRVPKSSVKYLDLISGLSRCDVLMRRRYAPCGAYEQHRWFGLSAIASLM